MKWRQAALIALCAALLFWATWQAMAVGDHLQYLLLAPEPEITLSGVEGEEEAPKPNAWITTWQEGLTSAAEEWSGSIRDYTMNGIVELQSYMTESGGSASGRLTLFGTGGQRISPLYLRAGRLLNPDELKNGDRVALLDEQLALALFRVSEPIDQTFYIGSSTYRVVGVVRHTRRVGDSTLYGAYIPLTSVIAEDLRLTAVQVEATPVAGTGAGTAFSSTIQTWQSGGTMIDLGKEGMGAWLWLRVTLFLIGMAVLLRAVRLLNRRVSLFYRQWKLRLQEQYALRLLPWAGGGVAVLAGGYLLCAGGFGLLMTFILRPVYTFPEWVPAVLVEWSDIETAFWKVWGGAATLVELRSPELNRLRFLTLIVNGFSALLGVLFFRAWARLETPTDRVAGALPALYRQGVAVSVLRSAKPMPLEDLGYTRLEGEWTASRAKRTRRMVPLLRIVNVRRVLAQLPPSARDGSFVLEVFDPQIAVNNLRLEITCREGVTTITEARRDWDMRCSVETLARIIYGRIPLDSFLESRMGVELHMRSPAMDGLFAGHLREDGICP